jgi:EAL domain-containing protein (putative c-di-GMP-specific phosphodiesterase class I)
VEDAVEALVRWNHPELGPLSPQAFVPLAEQTGLIGELTRWVASAAVRQSRRWRDTGFPVRVAVNVTARDLLDARFVSHLEQELERASLPAGALQLEVTETQLLGEAREAQLAVARLRRAGVSCAIDDFGTGFSSLSQLQRLQVDEIKIDQSFVAGLDESASNRAIVQATVGLARNLGLRVTAEGVETRAALERLIELGCDYAQGFYVGKPMPADACRALLADAEGVAAERLRRFGLGLGEVSEELRPAP